MPSLGLSLWWLLGLESEDLRGAPHAVPLLLGHGPTRRRKGVKEEQSQGPNQVTLRWVLGNGCLIELCLYILEPSCAFISEDDVWRVDSQDMQFWKTISNDSSYLLLVVRPGAPSSVLAPSSDARSL